MAFFVLDATLAQNATPQTAAALSVMLKIKTRIDDMESYRLLFAPLRIQMAFFVVGVALMLLTETTLRNGGLPLAVALVAGLSVGGASFIVVMLFARTQTKIGEALRKRVYLTSNALGSLSISAILTLSVTAGVFEELLFRGVLQSWLSQSLHYSVGIGLSAIIFGLLHPGSSATFIFTSLYGLMFGVAYHLTESIVFVMVWHATYDFIALTFVVKAPRYFNVRQNEA